jgi:hypothetical protein
MNPQTIDKCVENVKVILSGSYLDYILDPTNGLNHDKTFKENNHRYLAVINRYCQCKNYVGYRLSSYCNSKDTIRRCIKKDKNLIYEEL